MTVNRSIQLNAQFEMSAKRAFEESRDELHASYRRIAIKAATFYL